MIEILDTIDSNILIFLNSIHCSFFDEFMYLYSGRFIWIPMYASLLFMMLKRYSVAEVIIMVLGIALSILIADQISASVIRPIVHRLRPSNLDNPVSSVIHIVNGYRGGACGFPSCHAANSFALAIFAALMLQKRSFTLFIYAWATINVYSRIYLGVHYPGDILTGAVIGSLTGVVCFWLSNVTYKNIISRYPRLNTSPVINLKNIRTYNLNLMESIAILTVFIIVIISLFNQTT